MMIAVLKNELLKDTKIQLYKSVISSMFLYESAV